MVISNQNIKNPFKISKILIDDYDVSNHFEQLVIEEGLFDSYIFGTLYLSRLILNIPKEWNKKELGFLYKELKIDWSTDIDEGKKEYQKSLTFKIYGINKDNKDYISLLFIQEPSFNFFTKQFCDGWENTPIHTIISEIFSKQVKSNIEITSAPNIISFTNPLYWTPTKTCNYLLPMMGGNNYCYVLFSSSKEQGKTYCKPINEFLNSDVTETLIYIPKGPEDESNTILQTISEIISFNFEHINNNIFNQILNNIFGSIVNEYDIKTKNIITTNINNNIKNNIKQLGKNLSITDEISEQNRYKFYFSEINGKEVETNEALYEYLKSNYINVVAYGSSKRNIGDKINLDLSYVNQFLTDPRNEYNGECIISKIIHTFNKNIYMQKIHCFKSGLNDWNERLVTINN